MNQTQEPEPEPEPVVPLTVNDITIPEGYEVIEPFRDKFLEILNGELSPKDRAVALLDLHKQTLDAASETDSSAWDNMQAEWQKEVKTEFGAKLQPTLTNIGKIFDEYGSKELRDVLNVTGAGNNVHVIRFLSKIADTLTEGTHLTGAPTSVSANPEEAKAARLYPSMKG